MIPEGIRPVVVHPAHPYRIPAADDADERGSSEPGGDDHSLLWLVLAVGALRVIIALALGGAWGAEPTIALMLVLFAGWHLARISLADARRRRARRRSPSSRRAGRAPGGPAPHDP
ncbi:MAG: hypothetical protein IT372_20755 [Polyangiaceae bacterium]|nr:hypothetical protein [Polyangiaceae bacterium]